MKKNKKKEKKEDKQKIKELKEELKKDKPPAVVELNSVIDNDRCPSVSRFLFFKTDWRRLVDKVSKFFDEALPLEEYMTDLIEKLNAKCHGAGKLYVKEVMPLYARYGKKFVKTIYKFARSCLINRACDVVLKEKLTPPPLAPPQVPPSDAVLEHTPQELLANNPDNPTTTDEYREAVQAAQVVSTELEGGEE